MPIQRLVMQEVVSLRQIMSNKTKGGRKTCSGG